MATKPFLASTVALFEIFRSVTARLAYRHSPRTREAVMKEDTSFGTLHLASLVCLMFVLWLPSQAQAQTNPALGVERAEKLPGDLLKITFTNADPSILNFSLSRKTNLVSGSTSFLDWQVPIKELGGGRHEITIPTPVVTPVFYRIASFSGADTDGDGLADALERLIGTDPNRFDTDGDGFGDGVEVANGTSPFNASSIPALTIANFTLTTSAAREGEGTISLRVNFARPQPRPWARGSRSMCRCAGYSPAQPYGS